MSLIAFIFISILFVLNTFVIFRLYYLIKEKSYKISFFISLGTLVTFLAFVFGGFIFEVGFFWQVGLYYFTFIFLLFFINLFYWVIFSFKQLKNKKIMQLALIGITLFVYVVYGVFNANSIVITEIDLESDKISKAIKFVQLSDSHVGSESPKFWDRIIDNVNSIDKDFVVITGDLLDGHHLQLQDLQSINKIDVPVYFIIGNHELIAEKNLNFFANLDLIILNNEKIAFNDEFEIIGINIYDPNGSFDTLNVSDLLENIEIDDSKYNLLLNHEPDQLYPVIDKKIDLQISGHTHNGQIWPFNYLIKLRYKYIYGLYELSEDTRLYVSSGVGTWGPNIRVGSRNEIVLFNLEAKRNN